MKLPKLKRKGSIQDILMIGIILVVLSVIILVVYKISNEINTEFQASDQLESNGKNAMNQVNNMYPGIIDNSFLLIAVGLAIAAFILAALVRVHPVFIVFYIIVLTLVIFFCGIFSNIYQGIAENPEFTTVANNLTFASHIMEFLPFIVGIFGSLLAIVMYKTWQGAQGI